MVSNSDAQTNLACFHRSVQIASISLQVSGMAYEKVRRHNLVQCFDFLSMTISKLFHLSASLFLPRPHCYKRCLPDVAIVFKIRPQDHTKALDHVCPYDRLLLQPNKYGRMPPLPAPHGCSEVIYKPCIAIIDDDDRNLCHIVREIVLALCTWPSRVHERAYCTQPPLLRREGYSICLDRSNTPTRTPYGLSRV